MNKKGDPVKITLIVLLKSLKLSNCFILLYFKHGARTQKPYSSFCALECQ